MDQEFVRVLHLPSRQTRSMLRFRHSQRKSCQAFEGEDDPYRVSILLKVFGRFGKDRARLR